MPDPSSILNFHESFCAPDSTPVTIDFSAMGLDSATLAALQPSLVKAFAAMRELEAGAIANPDEGRMVGHYWLRALDRIPDANLREDVAGELTRLRNFVDEIHAEGRFRQLLVVGIGGSALGPQLVADALGADVCDRMAVYFLDNTDPDGIERVLQLLKPRLRETLVLVISKSGGTPETRNGMKLTEAFFAANGVEPFGEHAVAVTGRGSQLDQYAEANRWRARFAMYDWVGGRTSVMSAVGLLPAALQGINVEEFLRGAAQMDEATRRESLSENPAAVLAVCWYVATNGRGEKDMVVLPYNDRLLLFSRYLQQLVMESLGKERDLDGKVVEQGIAVYGNKGSTDQHAYVQQLRDGVNNFFVVFVEVLRQVSPSSEVAVEDAGFTAGDYLSGFYQGTRQALLERGRRSLTISIEEVTPETLGALIALFERAVGLYATMININAYHQPGVEAGKKAAAGVLSTLKKLQGAVVTSEQKKSAAAWAADLGIPEDHAYRILRYLAVNGKGVAMTGVHPAAALFGRA